MDRKRALLAFVLGVAGCCGGCERAKPPVQAPAPRAAAASEMERFQAISFQVESNYEAGLTLLRAHDYSNAYARAILEGRNVAAPFVQSMPSNAARPGVMIADWAQRLELNYRVECSHELDRCIGAARTDPAATKRARSLAVINSDYPELGEKLDNL